MVSPAPTLKPGIWLSCRTRAAICLSIESLTSTITLGSSMPQYHSSRTLCGSRPSRVMCSGKCRWSRAKGYTASVVAIPQHDHVLDAHEVGGGTLLARPPLGELVRGQGPVGGARVTVGAQHVRHLAARGHPF